MQKRAIPKRLQRKPTKHEKARANPFHYPRFLLHERQYLCQLSPKEQRPGRIPIFVYQTGCYH